MQWNILAWFCEHLNHEMQFFFILWKNVNCKHTICAWVITDINPNILDLDVSCMTSRSTSTKAYKFDQSGFLLEIYSQKGFVLKLFRRKSLFGGISLVGELDMWRVVGNSPVELARHWPCGVFRHS